MNGVPVVIVEAGGVPVTPVEANAPLMTIADNGLGAPITIAENAAPVILQNEDGSPWEPAP